MSLEELMQALAAYNPYDAQEESDKALLLRYLRAFPENILTRENEEAHFTASAWVANRRRDRVLMVFHNIYRSWSWTGGHADGESDLLAVALREVREESGLQTLVPVSRDIFSVEALKVEAHEKRGKHIAPHLHLNCTFLIEADEQELCRVKPDENSAVAWFPVEEAIAFCAEEQMRPIYRKLADKVKRTEVEQI